MKRAASGAHRDKRCAEIGPAARSNKDDPNAMSALLDRQRTIFSARRWGHAALRALCAAPRVALRALCAVPDVALRAPCVVPDAAPCQTSRYPWAVSLAWRVWWWFGLQPAIPSELQTKRQVQMPPRIQIKRERFDDKPAWAPNFHPFSCSRFSALKQVT
jgi:hypothetical protein